ncbi:adenylate kinase [candidate division WOR-1 bacterium RIFOXYA12_FULL_43_27]|uniref:Adenylate kinase n=1 Tax=candidate division WOR-1 bacterium RIFOXYC2_FULL_46_14 TaxID=1802587 RepID=A0A1F4U7J9_UNCSA|nr:MAG: adenylate kinase [candidate division WOR-1 bacterium RIFOXYA12_FULL_43_27]OGC20428.1 MAG: adenylate kinase [candidate division WOR-1 bacterium RIFOXYB2_FULL_46_45]OGC31835.1 MAG: adenylate kinase [candidate division WOR-1 bacterium RIFOXYA2_FULL_46_56]OGC40273.1 MAG: adenylate kinase [candidate division WOR-1 bacterium RIFOXYC2_FULL_46_14]
MIVILMGPPGSGKGTQAVKLADKLELPHIAVGDMLRDAIAAQSELGRKAEQYMNQGKLVPDQLTIDLVKERLSNVDCENGFILDGFPRSKAQAEALDEVLEDMEYSVVYFDIPLDEVVRRNSKRFSCRACRTVYSRPGTCDKCGGELYQREDDKEDVIRSRYEVYVENTKPLVDFYKDREKLIEVNGVGEIEDIFGRLLETLKV